MKARKWENLTTGETGISFYCEGCKGRHAIPTSGPQAWEWSGDLEKPVLSPSLLTVSGNADGPTCCHSFVGCNGAQPGEIIFLSDCTHALAGQVRPLPDHP